MDVGVSWIVLLRKELFRVKDMKFLQPKLGCFYPSKATEQ